MYSKFKINKTALNVILQCKFNNKKCAGFVTFDIKRDFDEEQQSGG